MLNEASLLSSLRALAEKTLNDCTHIKVLDFEPEPARVLLPSGDEKYYAFWVRDTAMMAESHLIPDADLRRYVAMTAAYGQNGPGTRYLLNGLQVPPYAVTDHINYNGKPVFFPGMYRDGDDQGDGTYGSYPPFCDNYYFITMTGDYIAQSGDKAILDEVFSDITLRDRLRRAIDGYNLDPETGLCRSVRGRFTVNWGFVDSTAQSGQLLFASLLRMNAARHMETLCPGEGYGALAESLRGAILRTFYDEETGWFWSSDDSDRQHDVWGTAYAVYLGVPDEARARRTARTLADAYVSGRTGVDGYIRHIPIGEDWQPGVPAWARCSVPINWYQNGTFWATPTGWYAYAVSLCDRGLGLSILSDFLSHTERYADKGAPFEWMQADSRVYSGCLYGTSGVLPYAGLCRILKKKH